MFFILYVLNDPDLLDPMINAWEEAGVKGITVLASTGMARLRERGALREDLPLIPSLDDIIEQYQDTNRTLFTIVQTQEVVHAVVHATEKIVGDLDAPNTGILVVLPVVQAYGLNRRSE